MMNQTEINITNETTRVRELTLSSSPCVSSDLKKTPQWITYKFLSRPNAPKLTKPPVNPHTGLEINAFDLKNFLSFEQAISLLKENKPQNLAGIGFVFTGGEIYSGIDIDHCIDQSGKITPEAEEIINRMNSYTEISPSGTGIRIIGIGKLPNGDRGGKHGDYEVYSEKRYLTITGNIYQGQNTIREFASELEWFRKTFATKSEEKPSSRDYQETQQSSKLLSDDDILKIIGKAKNAAKIQDLMNGGGDSEGDAALINHFLFYTKDVSQIERLMRKSGRTREKWNERRGNDNFLVYEIKRLLKKYRGGSYCSKTKQQIENNSEKKITNEEIEKTFDNQNLKILGHTYDGELLLWYRGRLLSKKISEVSGAWVSLLTGCIPGLGKQIRDNWIIEAHKAGVFDSSKKLGAGVWPTKNGWIVVSGNKALVVNNNGTIETTSSPCVDGVVIEHNNDPWVDLELIKNLKGSSLSDCFSKLKSVVSQWTWATEGMADVATAAIMLSPFQRLMTWRPWISMVGATSSGKSLFIEMILKKLFGGLLVSCDKTTAHGAAQTVGGKGSIPVFDEFDKNKHVSDVLELFKLTGRGGIKQSGTNKEHAYKFEIKHMPWFLAASSPGAARHDAALANRFVHLELNSGRDRTPPTPMTPESAKGLTAKIVASIIGNWEVINQHSKQFEKEPIGNNLDPRMLDNYSFIIGLLRAATSIAWEIPTWENCNVRSDGDIALHNILDTIPYQEKKSVREMLSNADTMKNCEKYGVVKTISGGIEYLAVRTDTVIRHLLKDTPLKDVAIEDHLKRIPGAKKGHLVKIDGQPQRCTLIPMDYVNPKASSQEPVTNLLPKVTESVTNQTQSNSLYNNIGNKVTNNSVGENKSPPPSVNEEKYLSEKGKFPNSQAENCYSVTKSSKPVSSLSLPGNKSVTKDVTEDIENVTDEFEQKLSDPENHYNNCFNTKEIADNSEVDNDFERF